MIKRLTSLNISGEGTPIRAVDVLTDGSKVFFVADADIDCDGSGPNPEHDPSWQPDTTYHYNGKALNAYQVPFVVVPKEIIRKVKPIVLGCKALVTYHKTGLITECVVGDVGPSFKLGELSPEAAKRLGMPPSPINGGEDNYNQVLYEIFPGVPAVIDGIAYPLQAS